MSSSPCWVDLVDTGIFHNSHTALYQTHKFLAFLWCPFLDLRFSKPLGYLYGCSASASSSCRYLCYQHSYKSQSELLRSLVFQVSDFPSNCLLVLCLVLSLHQYLWNLISTKFGKSIEMAKILSSCKVCANGWFNRGEAALLPTQREKQDCLQSLPSGSGSQHSQDPCGSLLRTHRR